MASASFVGAQTVQTIYSFSNGAYPNGLTLGKDGKFYGTTEEGGTYGLGTVFQVTTNGTLITLLSFTNAVNLSALTLGSDGNFYGTTEYGGTYGSGTVFQITSNGTLTTLATFNGTNGASPNGLTLGNDGNCYGITLGGGNGGAGTVFQITTNGIFTMLASFNSPILGSASGLTLGSDGDFYGTTAYDDIYGDMHKDTVFQVTTNGTFTTLATFPFPNAESVNGLALGKDGNFYGTSAEGGIINSIYPYGEGTVFQVTTNGAFTMLDSFNFTNGESPEYGLTLGNDGNFYGTTLHGGITNAAYSQGMGTVFQVTTNGTLITLGSFNGASPSGLTLGNDGNFYGTTEYGGTYGLGTVFQLLLAPAISVQPQSQTTNAGAKVTFSVSATSLDPMGYQWIKNGTNLANGGNISGATNSNLSITNISETDAASYFVVVSNPQGSSSSSNATLTVNDSLFIATQPLSQTVAVGSTVSVTFTAEVYGAPPFVFQWYFNGKAVGQPTIGSNFTSFTLTSVGTNQAGNYVVEVINDSGSLTSSNAVLTVIPQPTLNLQIVAGYPVLNLYGTPGNDFLVQYSTNLANTNWINLLSLTNLSTKSYLFLDPSGVDQPSRFYRAFFSP